MVKYSGLESHCEGLASRPAVSAIVFAHSARAFTQLMDILFEQSAV
jgi:hypothetical protein